MDFARQQLEKYGWKEGEGLGKKRTGISKALKPKLKFDNAGLGHNLSDEIINPWWQRVYNNAATNVKVVKDDDTVNIEAGITEITTKRKKTTKLKSKEQYNNFVKRAALTEEGEKRFGSEDDEDLTNEPAPKRKTSGICDLTDEELFKACGRRTAHKGARHGLSMSAKLKRSELLEQEMLQKLKKPKKNAEPVKHCDVPELCDPEVKSKKKKKKRKRDQ